VGFGSVTDEGGPPGDEPGRFGAQQPERYAGVVAEPESDPNYLQTRVNARGSRLVSVETVDTVPIGWAPAAMPFRDPQPLSGGRPGEQARLYLSEPGLAPRFLQLSAFHPGRWGNEISVTCRASAPAVYDLEISYPGGRFERSRDLVGRALATAKAAGARTDVTRDGAAPVVAADPHLSTELSTEEQLAEKPLTEEGAGTP
jgi:hypothetical protein